MVENFTAIEEENYTPVLEKENILEDDQFEAKVRLCVQKLVKEPRQSVIENLLNYSRSL